MKENTCKHFVKTPFQLPSNLDLSEGTKSKNEWLREMLPEAVERFFRRLGDKSAVFIPSLYGGIFQYENFSRQRGDFEFFNRFYLLRGQ